MDVLRSQYTKLPGRLWDASQCARNSIWTQQRKDLVCAKFGKIGKLARCLDDPVQHHLKKHQGCQGEMSQSTANPKF